MATRRRIVQAYGTAMILAMTIPSAAHWYSIDHNLSRPGVALWLAALVVPAFIAGVHLIDRAEEPSGRSDRPDR